VTPDRTSRLGTAPVEDSAGRLGALLARAQAGDRAAWDLLFAELNPRLWHLARAQDLTPDEAMDAVQVAWLELLRHVHTLRSPRALTGWLITTTKREAWRAAARRRRDRGLDVAAAGDVPDPAPTPDRLVELADRDQVLWDLVEELPPRCRQLLRMVALQPRPDYDAIVDALGMPKGSIGPTRGRCLALLRERLATDPRWSA
jgi:RNA polymerase sigma factor (sigma-70 family)